MRRSPTRGAAKLLQGSTCSPLLGRTEEGVWCATGCGGHGIILATHLHTEVGGLIGGSTDDSPFSGLPHPTRPHFRGSPWFLPAGGLMFRALDKIGR